VHGGDDEVEHGQPRAVVHRAVRQDVGLCSTEDAHRRDLVHVLVDLAMLLPDAVLGQAAGVIRRLGVVGQPHVFEPAVPRGHQHFADRVPAVGKRGVDVKRAAEIGRLHEPYPLFSR
jgi:hypothetical protein